MRQETVTVNATITCDRCHESHTETRERLSGARSNFLSEQWAQEQTRDCHYSATNVASKKFTKVDGRDLCEDCVKIVRSVMLPIVRDTSRGTTTSSQDI